MQLKYAPLVLTVFISFFSLGEALAPRTDDQTSEFEQYDKQGIMLMMATHLAEIQTADARRFLVL